MIFSQPETQGFRTVNDISLGKQKLLIDSENFLTIPRRFEERYAEFKLASRNSG